jgi:hypothetical protein
MRFAQLVDELPADKRRDVQARVTGLRDLFGNYTLEQMTPLFIEEKLESTVRLSPQGGYLSRGSVSSLRSALRGIFHRAAETGKFQLTPVLRGGGRGIQIQVARLRALELLERLKSTKGKRADVGREAVSLIRRIAGDELADLIHALLGLGSSPHRGPRKENTRMAYQLAVSFAAKHPEANYYGIVKHCAANNAPVDKWEVKKWLVTNDFNEAVRRERGEIPTEKDIRAANSARRRCLANKTSWAGPGADERKRRAQEKRLANPHLRPRLSRGVKKSWKLTPEDKAKRTAPLRTREARESASKKSISYWHDEKRGEQRRRELSERSIAFWANHRGEMVSAIRKGKMRARKESRDDGTRDA